MNLLQFKAEIAACLCLQGKTEIRNRWSPSLSQVQSDNEVKRKRKPNANPAQEIRRDETGHWPIFT